MKIIKILIIIFVAIGISLFFVKRFFVSEQEKAAVSQAEPQTIFAPQTNSEGSVIVKVTPKEVSEDRRTWSFAIVLDTHTENLDQDLVPGSFFVDNTGNTVRPLSWQGDPTGGHHREGVLLFEAFPQEPQAVTLFLQNIGGVSERKFFWEIKK